MIHIVSALYGDFHPLETFFPDAACIVAHEPAELPEGKGILILHGGADIHPSLYGAPIDGSHVQANPSRRDTAEVSLFHRAVELGYTILGICRGAQLACALSGGKLIQDVGGHTFGAHLVELRNGRRIMTNSIHHQMMYPWGLPEDEIELLGWAAPPRSARYRGLSTAEKLLLDDLDNRHEPEIVWFHKSKCLAVQGHPEMLAANSDLNLFVYSELKHRMDA